MNHWKNTCERSQKEQRLLLGQLLKKKLLSRSKEAKWFSILVDELTDCAVIEQLLIYVGYVDEAGETHLDFLEVKNCLALSDSANAETIKQVITGARNGVGANYRQCVLTLYEYTA